jgi:hypothetical protein
MNYDREVLVQIATKYLDRIEVKGLNELHEFNVLVRFFQDVAQNNVEIKSTVEIPLNPEI